MQYKLAETSEIEEGKSLIVKGPDGLEIVLFKQEGEIFALENVCPHMGGPLGDGEIESCMVTCPWHGWQFDIKTGACENMPGDDARKINISVIGNDIFMDE
jgi:nitrite reductase (NADH) small subunit